MGVVKAPLCNRFIQVAAMAATCNGPIISIVLPENSIVLGFVANFHLRPCAV
jgi:hypothetical protein